MKKNYVSLCLFCITSLSGQIGINTSNPQASLDIVAQSSATAKGLLVPRLTSAEIFAMTTQNKLGSEQHSLIVFATDTPSHSTFVTSKITEPGFYRYTYNGSSPFQQYWRRMEPTAFERIIQAGKSGIRFIDADIQKYGAIGNNAVDISFSDQLYAPNGATGDYSFAAGLNTISRGNASTTLGTNTEAGGTSTFAGGKKTRSVGINSFAFGEESQATQTNSLAFGKLNYAQGDNSSILGGTNNKVNTAANSSILTGINNEITYSGTPNLNPTTFTGVNNSILGGGSNKITGSVYSNHNSIVGGSGNLITEGRSNTISGGVANKIKPGDVPYDQVWLSNNNIAGGSGNEINAYDSFIGGGDRNLIKLAGSHLNYPDGAGNGVIVGGQFNKIINAHYGSVLGGRGNASAGSYSIAGGIGNAAQSVGEVSLGLFGTLYTPQYPDAYTYSGYSAGVLSDPANSKDRLFNLGNGKATRNYNYDNIFLTVGNFEVTRSDAFTVLKNGQVGIDIDSFHTNTSNAKLQVNGGIKMGAQSATLSGNICDNNNRGQIIFVEDNFYGCKSTGWVLLNN
ncbi:hypothetical protein [Chryseobacterium indologenes]|uniref:Hep_Hag n=1 Tax=Chryseobacterium indologenes TaxID=253 RepID=A0A0N0IY10_CHRID|nr:hypothetical protein [Chryseobacterium indologenes]KPE52741.1 hypothetical protein AOB46_01670 [Chryseobacterium indologenes]